MASPRSVIGKRARLLLCFSSAVVYLAQVCWDRFLANRDWVLFQCKHGTCVPCYQRLLQQPGGAAACPLCRLPLMEPAPAAQLPPGQQTLQQ